MKHQFKKQPTFGGARVSTVVLIAVLSLAFAPAVARECIDYASFGGPNGDPAPMGGLLLPSDALDLAVQAGLAYLACGDGGLQVVDLSAPSMPLWVGAEDLQGDAVTVAVWGHLALVGVGSTIKVVDITSADDPQWVQSLGVGGHVFDVVIEGTTALVSVIGVGLVTLDVAAADLLGSVASVSTSATARSAAMSVDGATAWAATDAGVEIVALDRDAPALISTLVTGRAMRRVVRDGDLLWAASDDGLLLACDVSDPRAPRELRRHSIASPVVDLSIASGIAYMVCADGLTRVAETGAMGMLLPTGRLASPGGARAIAGSGPYLALADGPGGIQTAPRQCDMLLAVGPARRPKARLMGVVPNPLNPSAKVIFSLASPAHVRVAVHDARGRTVEVLTDETRPAGAQQVEWSGCLADGGRAPAGVWYVRMESGGRSQTRALTVLR